MSMNACLPLLSLSLSHAHAHTHSHTQSLCLVLLLPLHAVISIVVLTVRNLLMPLRAARSLASSRSTAEILNTDTFDPSAFMIPLERVQCEFSTLMTPSMSFFSSSINSNGKAEPLPTNADNLANIRFNLKQIAGRKANNFPRTCKYIRKDNIL